MAELYAVGDNDEYFYNYNYIVLADTTVTCEVRCEAQGAGTAEMKYGKMLSQIGQGVISSPSDQPSPFTVSATAEADQEGYLLLFSKTSRLFR